MPSPLSLSAPTLESLTSADEVYSTELLRQSLIDARERENRLLLELETAREEKEESKRLATVSKIKFQELDDALEIEEAKTNAERLARQEAEETARQHLEEVLKAKRNETNANKHCDAAESEVLRLEKELSTECSARMAANLLSCQLQEDLKLAGLHQATLYDQLNAAKADVCTMQEEFRVATDHIGILEGEATELKQASKEEQQRAEEAESSLNTIACELNNNKLKLSHCLEQYNDLQAEHSDFDCIKSMTATALETNSMGTNLQFRDHVEDGESTMSEHECESILEIGTCTENPNIAIARLMVSKIDPTAKMDMPAPFKPAILRPALSTGPACQVEILKATGRVFPAHMAGLKHSKWKFLWNLLRKPGRH